jgi:hypothetical protein
LPTSLTYIILWTRGCSPWRPDAVMSTTKPDNPAPLDFHGPSKAHRTTRKMRCFTSRLAPSPVNPIPGRFPHRCGVREAVKKKRELFPGLPPASRGSFVLPPPRPARAPCGAHAGRYPGFGSGILTGFPFGHRQDLSGTLAGTEKRRLRRHAAADAILLLSERSYPMPQGRLTRDQLLFSRNLSPLRPSKFSFEYLLLPPRSALGAVPPRLTPRGFTTHKDPHVLLLLGTKSLAPKVGYK